MRYFAGFGSFPGALRTRKSGCRYTDTFCGRIFTAIFAKVKKNECIMHRQSRDPFPTPFNLILHFFR